MQLSTNRVNFTNTSVSQFNYVKFLSKFRSSRHRDVQDIKTILGLHSEDLSYYDIISVAGAIIKPKYQRALSKYKNNKSIVPFVSSKKLKFYVEKCFLWYQCVIVVVKRDGFVTEISCDLKTRTMKLCTKAESCVIRLKGNKCYLLRGTEQNTSCDNRNKLITSKFTTFLT